MSKSKFNKLGVEIVGAVEAAGWSITSSTQDPHSRSHNSGDSMTGGSITSGSMVTGGSMTGGAMTGGSVFWWKLVLMPLLHGIGNPMLSEKSLQGLMRRLKGDKEVSKMQPSNKQGGSSSKKNTKSIQSDYQLQKCEENKRLKRGDKDGSNSVSHVVSDVVYPKDGWLELRKEYVTYLQNGNLFIFKQSLVPQVPKEKNTTAGADGRSNQSAKTSKQSNIPIYHAPEGSILPLPPLAQVLTFLQSQDPADLRSDECVQWGPWKVSASIKHPSVNNRESGSTQCDVVNGMISLSCHPQTWLNMTKTKKQCQLLPCEQFPCLDTLILGECLPTLPGSSSKGSFSDMKVLMGGKFSYCLLFPLNKTTEWQLSLSPCSKLPPLRLLDTNLRRMIPIVQPTSFTSEIPSSNKSLYCIVEIDYEFME